MSEGLHPGEDPENVCSNHNPPRFQFITVSHPASTKDAATKAIVRKHVMGEIGRVRRLSSKKRKPVTIPLLVPSQDASATDCHQSLEGRSYDSQVTHDSPWIFSRAGGLNSASHPKKTDNNNPGPLTATEVLIGKFAWLGAGALDPFTKYPFEMCRSDHALVAHSKLLLCRGTYVGISEVLPSPL